MVIGLERGADLHMVQVMPLPLTVSCFSKIQIGFTFLVPAQAGSHGQTAVKRYVCVCVCAVALNINSITVITDIVIYEIRIAHCISFHYKVSYKVLKHKLTTYKRRTTTQQQPFNSRLSGTTRVGRYQKKHSLAHTHPGQRTSFITFFHLQRSTASSLFSLRA